LANPAAMSTLQSTTSAGEPSSTAEQAKQKAQDGAQQAKRTVRDQVDQRSTQAGERVSTTAGDIRSVGEELRSQGKEQPARLAEQAAQRAESLGGYLQRSDGDTILRDIEDFGRRQPWTMIAGGLAIGFAASRFLKASSERRSQPAPQPSRSFPAGTAAGDAGNGMSSGIGHVPPPAGTSTAPGDYGGTGLYRDDSAAAR
jgi:hypothetical protein